LSQPDSPAPSRLDRLRDRFGTRTRGFVLALLVELLVVLMIFTLAPDIVGREDGDAGMTVFGVTPEPEPEAETEDKPAPSAAPNPARVQPAETQPDPAPQPPVPQPQPQPSPPVLLNIPLGRMPDIAALPRQPVAPAAPRRAAGPPNLASLPGDTPRVEGRGPRGEPLYAAAWYREPYDSELSGYLSTASGPGWGLIACRTVPDFRVDDCIMLDEYPEGSKIARAVLAAAWQFRVRPPRLGGQPKIGEWVRIRIDYWIKRQTPP
jgi:protein TonB